MRLELNADHRDQHRRSLLLQYSFLSYTITRYAGIYRHAAGPCAAYKSVRCDFAAGE